MHRLSSAALAAAATLAVACVEREEPPGVHPAAEPVAVSVGTTAGVDGAAADAGEDEGAIGTRHDNLPFQPTGKKLASIAWRTWVYTDTGPKRTRYGYLRAGAVVDARESGVVENEGCVGAWYRINPRGFVCIGKGATLDLAKPLIRHTSVRPVRGNGLPYVYALSREVAPHLYFRLPSVEQMQEVEGENIPRRVFIWRQRAKARGDFEQLGPIGSPPDFLSNVALEKPYGVPKRLHYSVHAGRAASDSGFAIQRVFEHEGRVFGLTTELDVIALDRTKIVKPSELRGIVLEEGEGLPVAFVESHQVTTHVEGKYGELKAKGAVPHRTALKLSGETRGGSAGMWKTVDGKWVPAAALRILKARDSWPSFAEANRKWIDISIRRQTLVAYEGKQPVYATLVSTGRGGMGDPEKSFATVRGTFMIHAKHVTATMDGDEDKSDSFNLRDVPFVQYFHKGYALHGTYWHDEFGKVRSHGCVNLAPVDAAWLFEWTDPRVPEGWHAAINKERGTVVYVHP